jgi:hypothetical protein
LQSPETFRGCSPDLNDKRVITEKVKFILGEKFSQPFIRGYSEYEVFRFRCDDAFPAEQRQNAIRSSRLAPCRAIAIARSSTPTARSPRPRSPIARM